MGFFSHIAWRGSAGISISRDAVCAVAHSGAAPSRVDVAESLSVATRSAASDCQPCTAPMIALDHDLTITLATVRGEGDTGKKAAELLAERLSGDHAETTATLETIRAGGTTLMLLTACPLDVAEAVRDGLGDNMARRSCLVPLAPVLWRRAGGGRRGVLSLDVLEDGTRGLAILGWGRTALAWRSYCAGGGKGPSMEAVAAVRGLAEHAAQDLALGSPAELVLRSTDFEADAAAWQARLDMPTRSAPGIPMGPEACARTLARQGRRQGPDLLDQVRRPPTWVENVPWVSAAALTAVLLGSAGSLVRQRARLAWETAGMDDLTAQHLAATGLNAARLPEARERWAGDLSIAADFVACRARWAPLLREIDGFVPPGMELITIGGDDPGPASLAGTREFVLSAEAVGEVGDMVVAMTEALARSTAVGRVVPRIGGATVQTMAERDDDASRIIVRCTPEDD